MTNEEAKVFLDNLKTCVEEHPIVADWLVEIADRKTEPTGYNLSPVDKDINVRSKTEPQTEDEYITELIKKKCEGEPQTMYYPQVDGITPSVIEPQTYITEDRDTQIFDAWQVHHRSTTSVETEPQTERSK